MTASMNQIDFTFYRPLLDRDLTPTPAHRQLAEYRSHLAPGDRLVLKAPQQVSARRLYRGGGVVDNPDHLDGILFEQEYHRRADRLAPETVAGRMATFFRQVPADERYHVELRTPAYLSQAWFDTLADSGVGQVLSHWTWLPPLARQFAAAGRRVFNRGRHLVIRLVTPRRMAYAESYAQAFPFDRVVPGLLEDAMLTDALDIVHTALGKGSRVSVIINNRAGGMNRRRPGNGATRAPHRPPRHP